MSAGGELPSAIGATAVTAAGLADALAIVLLAVATGALTARGGLGSASSEGAGTGCGSQEHRPINASAVHLVATARF